MIARDLMRTTAATVWENASLADVYDLFVEENINGAPVVDALGRLVGIVTQQDVFFGALGYPARETENVALPSGPGDAIHRLRVRDVMTSPAVCADEETDIADLCRLMWSMRINRVPIVRDGRVAGVVSSMDLCQAVSEGTLAVPL